MVAAMRNENVFTVVHEQVMTDTARMADVVLPATTQFEVNDVAGSYGSFVLQRVQKVIEPVGDARSNDWLGRELARRLNVEIATPRAEEIDIKPMEVVVSSQKSVQFRDVFLQMVVPSCMHLPRSCRFRRLKLGALTPANGCV